MKYGMNLKFETIVHIFRKIKQLITVVILKSSNKYHRKTISKSGHKMDLYPALLMINDQGESVKYSTNCVFYNKLSKIVVRNFYCVYVIFVLCFIRYHTKKKKPQLYSFRPG